MSAVGTKRTWAGALRMSASDPKLTYLSNAMIRASVAPVALRGAQNNSMRAWSRFRSRHVAVRYALLHAPIFRVRSFALLKANLLTRFLLRKGGRGHKREA